MFGQSICPDEINNGKGGLSYQMIDYWGECFSMGGIGGAPFVGRTGFASFTRHVKQDGHVFIFFGPHISISPVGRSPLMKLDPLIIKHISISISPVGSRKMAPRSAFATITMIKGRRSPSYGRGLLCFSCDASPHGANCPLPVASFDGAPPPHSRLASWASMCIPEGGKRTTVICRQAALKPVTTLPHPDPAPATSPSPPCP